MGAACRCSRKTGARSLHLAEHATAVTVGAMAGTLTVNLVNGDQAMVVEQQRVSASMLDVLGVRPLLGRGLYRR